MCWCEQWWEDIRGELEESEDDPHPTGQYETPATHADGEPAKAPEND